MRVPSLEALPEGSPLPSPRLSSFSVVEYEGGSTRLWSDRDYRTSTDVGLLMEHSFVRVPRNEDLPILLGVARPSTVYMLANRTGTAHLPEWKVLPDTVFVGDVYPPRRMDVLLSRELTAGVHVLRGPSGGPSHPLFFDPQDVTPVP